MQHASKATVLLSFTVDPLGGPYACLWLGRTLTLEASFCAAELDGAKSPAPATEPHSCDSVCKCSLRVAGIDAHFFPSSTPDHR